jgi:type II secretory pathway pseudopilin PulG
VSSKARDNRAPCRAAQNGFTYLGVLFAVAFIGAALGVAGQVWSIASRRAAESDLLFVGDSYRRAIASYYRSGLARQYPQSLDELLLDTRVSPPHRHLRKLYADPITRRNDWTILALADGAIIGVASSSMLTPMKTRNFGPEDGAFEDAQCYCEWQFTFLPLLAPLERSASELPDGD